MNSTFPRGAFPKISQRVSAAVQELREASREAKSSLAVFVGEKGEPYMTRSIVPSEAAMNDPMSQFSAVAMAMMEEWDSVMKLSITKSGINPMRFFAQNFFANILVITFIDRLHLFTYDEDGDRGIEPKRLAELLSGRLADDLVSQHFYDVWYSVDVEDARRLTISVTNDNRYASSESEQAFRLILGHLANALVQAADKISGMGDGDNGQSPDLPQQDTAPSPFDPTDQPNPAKKHIDIADLLNGLDLF